MTKSARADAMARWIWDARQRREAFRNLPDELRPASIAEAYAAQEVYYRLAEPVYGAVAGAKIATTTKVMQRLMGIDHACGGAIFARTIHHSRPNCAPPISSTCASKAKSRSSSAPTCGHRARHGQARRSHPQWWEPCRRLN
jgi:2-keto-4-pentenoate hydratase